MKKEVRLPQLGSKISGGTLIAWYKKEGENITEDDLLYDLESDKAIHEVTSPWTGILVKCYVEEGDDVQLGDLLAEIEVVENE